jgi:hypothetical protein
MQVVTKSLVRQPRQLQRSYFGCSSCGSALGAAIGDDTYMTNVTGDYAFEVKSTRFKFGRGVLHKELGRFLSQPFLGCVFLFSRLGHTCKNIFGLKRVALITDHLIRSGTSRRERLIDRCDNRPRANRRR